MSAENLFPVTTECHAHSGYVFARHLLNGQIPAELLSGPIYLTRRIDIDTPETRYTHGVLSHFGVGSDEIDVRAIADTMSQRLQHTGKVIIRPVVGTYDLPVSEQTKESDLLPGLIIRLATD